MIEDTSQVYPGGKPQLHPSGIVMFGKCGEQFRRRFIEGEIKPPSARMVVGSGVDRGVTANLRNKIATGELLPEEQVLDVTRDALAHEWEKGVELSAGEVEEGEAKTKDEAVDKAVRLATLHARALAPTIEPIHVQRQFVIELPDLPFDLAGTLDIQEISRVRDLKTTAKSPDAAAAEVSIQLTAYALAIKVSDGESPREVALDYLVDLKKPKATTLVATRTDDDYLALLHRGEVIAQAIEADIFPPAAADSWVCTERWCGYYRTCRYVRKPVQITVPGGKK